MDLDRPVYRNPFNVDGDNTDDEEEDPPAEELALLEPLRQSLGSLQNLARLRLHGKTPFSYVLLELPPVKVGGASPH